MFDGVSRKIYLRSCLNKILSTVIKAFSSINDIIVRSEPVLMLQTDKVGEFFNASLKNSVKKIEFVILPPKRVTLIAPNVLYTLKTLVKRLPTANNPKIN